MMNKNSNIVFKRKLFFAEKLMHVYDRGSILLNLTLAIKGCVKEQNVRIALEKLQKKHPQLQMCIVDDSFIIREKVNPVALRIAERETDETWKTELKKEFGIPINYSEGPLMRVTWVRSDDFSEIIVLVPHTIMDGKSFFSLMKELAILIDDPEREVKVYSPISSLQELLPNVSLSWRDKLLAHTLVYPANLLLYLSTLGKKEFPVDHNCISWKLDVEDATLLKSIVNDHGVQLGALIAVLMSRSFSKYYRVSRKKRMIFMSLDMRRYIRTIKKDMLFSFAPMLRLNVKFDKDADLWKLAKALGDDIVYQALTKSTIKRTFVKYPITQGTLFTEYLHGMLKMLIRKNIRLDTGQDFNFINVGILTYPLKNNSIKVQNIMGEIRMPWRNPNIFYLMEINGELHFYLMTNNNLIAEKDILKIRDDFKYSVQELMNERIASSIV